MYPRRLAVSLSLALSILLPAARPAGAQPGERTPPPPDATPPTEAPAQAPAPAPGPRWPPAPGDGDATVLTPPAAAARDRLYIDAGLEAILMADLRRAEALFDRAALEASTPELRATAELLARRTAALADRRADLSPAITQRAAPRSPRPTSARPVFLLTTTVLGVAAWGWTLPAALGVDSGEDARAQVGLYMLTAASSFIVPYFATRSRPVTWGQANMAFYGGTRGLEYGLLISNLVFGEEGGNIDDNVNDRAFAASLLLGSVSGVIAGSWWAASNGMSAGDAHTVGVLGDWGLFAGFVTGHVFGWDELTGDFGEPRFDARARSMAAAGAVGSVLGLTLGRQLSLRRTNTWGDAEVMRGAALVGVMAGLTTSVAFDYDQSSEGTLATMVIGAGLGLAGGDLLVRDTNFSVGESILTDLALVSGGLGAAGVFYLITPDADDSAYLLAGTLGAAAGGGLSYWVLRDNGQPRARAGQPPSVALVPQLGRNGRAGLTLYGGF